MKRVIKRIVIPFLMLLLILLVFLMCVPNDMGDTTGEGASTSRNYGIICCGKGSGESFDTSDPSYVHAMLNVYRKNEDGDRVGYVTDLTTSDFVFKENDVEIGARESDLTIDEFDSIPNELKIVLMIDNSQSIGDNLGTLRKALISLVDDGGSSEELEFGQKIAIYKFTESAEKVLDFTSNKQALKDAINSIELGFPSTNIYGSAIKGLELWDVTYSTTKVEDGMLVLFTDGRHNANSKYDLTDVLNARGRKRVITVGVGDKINREELEELGNEGSFAVSSFSELSDKFSEIQKKIRNYVGSFYWVHYLSPKRDDNEYSLEISITDNGNTDNDAIAKGTFGSKDFYSVMPGVFINDTRDNRDGLESVFLSKGETLDLKVHTYYGKNLPKYAWTTSNDSAVSITDPHMISSIEGVATLNIVGDLSSDVTVTVTDTSNNFSKSFLVKFHYALTVDTVGSGSVSVSPESSVGFPSGTYLEDAVVNLTATADSHWHFVRWEGDSIDNATSSSVSVTMSSDKTITAVFEIDTHTLTISKTGNGSVAPTLGEHTYDYGTSVDLTATADVGWHFVRWEGDAVDDAASSSTSITMSSDKTVTAVFAHKLTVDTVGSGSVSVSPESSVGFPAGTYLSGEVVDLTATADSHWHFVRWEGDSIDNATSPSVSVTMSSDKTITAVFEIDTHTLTISKTGSGSVVPTLGEHTYDYGTSVDLTATADVGWHFVRWEGDAVDDAASSSTSITMTSDKTVTAVFAHILTVNIVGGGSVSMSPESSAGFPSGTYVYGTSVTLTAEGVENIIEFSSWSGDTTSTDSEITINMDCDKTITATFNSIVEKRDIVPITGGTYDQQGFSHTIGNLSIGKYEVTYELWHSVYEWAITNGYHFANAGKEGKYGSIGANPTGSKYHPVTTVNWRDCIVWCNAYSELMSLIPVYKSGGTVLKDSRDSNSNNCDNATCDWSSNGYRLPTEGEWQFAASNGGSTPSNYASGATAYYSNASACKEVAWYNVNSGSDTHPVGSKTANGLGLHDMSGNVWEWCWDWYAGYPSGPETDYHGAASGSYRVKRGGSWSRDASSLQVGCRNGYIPSYERNDLGFRVVRVP